ncbi:MAG TPA: hypothetical protein VMW22_05285 [Candidatus Desulfaltia sp.]|nr:hypothetical protein [Candidatus Desulfaltia sp.]
MSQSTTSSPSTTAVPDMRSMTTRLRLDPETGSRRNRSGSGPSSSS